MACELGPVQGVLSRHSRRAAFSRLMPEARDNLVPMGIARISIARSVRLARWQILEHEARVGQQRKWIAALEGDSDLASLDPKSREAMAKQARDALRRDC
jgi:hypothetical protein